MAPTEVAELERQLADKGCDFGRLVALKHEMQIASNEKDINGVGVRINGLDEKFIKILDRMGMLGWVTFGVFGALVVDIVLRILKKGG